MPDELMISAIPDNRPLNSRGAGKREPLVQVFIARFGRVESVTFSPKRAPEIAEAIAKAGRAAQRGRSIESVFVMDE